VKKIHAFPIVAAFLWTTLDMPLSQSLYVPATIDQKLVEEFDIISKNKEKTVSDEQPKEEKGNFFDRFKKSEDKDKNEEQKESSLLKTSK